MTPLYPSFKERSAFHGKARLILLNVSFLENEEVFERALLELSPSRQQKVRRFKVKPSALESLGAGLVLDKGLFDIGVRERDAQLYLGEQGKPYIRSNPPYYFNLSHSGGWVLGIFSGQEVGCDIQEENDHWTGISRHFFHPLEQNYIYSQPDEFEKRRAFFRLWTLKESFIKAMGSGLSTDLSSFCILFQECQNESSYEEDEDAPMGSFYQSIFQTEDEPLEKPFLAYFNGRICTPLGDGESLYLPDPEKQGEPWLCQLEEFSLPGLTEFHMAGCRLSPYDY